MQFTVLASGSAGNASLARVDGFGVLLDAGLGPRQLAERLQAAGLSWSAVQAVVLTHTHSDHWKDATLAHLLRRRVPLHCHPGHEAVLARAGGAYAALLEAGLVRFFEVGETVALGAGMSCRPLPVRHDGGPTFAFRLEGPPDLFGRGAAVGFATDLGCWDEPLADALADVDLLAVEFNHDVALERSSGRSAYLIQRVLGEYGHLSNEQAADLVRAVLGRSGPGRLQHVVQLHLSSDCNRVALARQAARVALADCACPARVQTASQAVPTPTFRLEAPRKRAPAGPRRPAALRVQPPPVVQGWLPGLEV